MKLLDLIDVYRISFLLYWQKINFKIQKMLTTPNPSDRIQMFLFDILCIFATRSCRVLFLLQKSINKVVPITLLLQIISNEATVIALPFFQIICLDTDSSQDYSNQQNHKMPPTLSNKIENLNIRYFDNRPRSICTYNLISIILAAIISKFLKALSKFIWARECLELPINFF